MSVLTGSIVTDGLVAIATLAVILYYYLTSTYDYWHKRGVPYVKPTVFFGNLKNQFLMKKCMILVNQDIYNNLAGNKFGGYYEMRTPVMMIRDPGLIEQVLIKDFSYFSDRDFGTIDVKRDPLSGNLFNLKGHVWRNLRNKLTPTFTTGKLKGMVEQMSNCGDKLLNEIEEKISKNESVNAKSFGTNFSIDVIASCSFGIQFTANSPENIKFREITNEVFGPSVVKMIRFFFILFCKPIAKLLRLRQFNKSINDYVIELVKTNMEYRQKNNIKRNDFLQLMMNLKEQEASGKEMNWKAQLSEEDAYLNQMEYVKDDSQEKGMKVITDECIAAQSFVFLTGGSEALSNAVSFILYELSTNPDVQRRLQDEVSSTLAKHNGQFTYEALKEMTYLDLIVQETNRLYALGAFLLRICNAPYKIPDTDIVIEKGVRINIPVYAIHHDPTHYPDPEKFIPERFEGNNYHNSGKYLPFGDGPRVCIAMRFVIVELKACIAKMMSKYSVTLDPRTKVPLTYDATTLGFVPVGGIWVKFHRKTTNTM